MHYDQHMAEIFRTDVKEPSQAQQFIIMLSQYFPGSRITFDLEDCDKVLRVFGDNISVEKIRLLFKKHDRICELLE